MPSDRVLKIQHDTVSNSVVMQIEDFILNGVLKENAKLPSERELAEQFVVSRPKVREALQLLESRELVKIVAGDGAYIARLGDAAMSPALVDLYRRHPSAVYDHLEYRSEQECFAARLAATRGTSTDRRRITELIEKMAVAHDDENHDLGAALDSAFHNAIVNASHNRILIHMMSSLYELNRSGVFFNRREILNISEVSGMLLDQHHAIGEAVCSGNAGEAVKAAAAHIDFVRRSTDEALAERERELIASKRAINV